MMDIVDKKTRSEMMSGIRSKNTVPEILIRKYLFSLGFRYRLHYKKLTGRPDIVLPKYRVVIFIHGCFWHRHKNCKLSYIPKSNIEFWKSKFEKNIQRDCVFHANWTLIPRQSGQSERSDTGGLV